MKNLVTIIIFSLSFAYYEIGDTISIVDQQVPHEICYGDYENDYYYPYFAIGYGTNAENVSNKYKRLNFASALGFQMM